MSTTLEQVRELVSRGEVRVSLHGYEELASDSIRVRDAVASLDSAVVIEDYPTYPKGPCVLVLGYDEERQPIHVVWGHPGGKEHSRRSRYGVPAEPRQVGRNMAKEAQAMSVTQTTRLVREADLVAEVGVELIEMEGGWSPYLSLDDANRLDDVRDALRAGDLERASRLSDQIYRLMPLTAER